MEEVKAIQLYEGASPPLSAANVRQQINLIQEIMHDAMKEGEHYGKIPGTDKPTLLKPGAEKLNLTFRMAPKYEIIRHDMPNGHREYEIICTLTSIGSEKFLGQGVGSCSTMESKYRYRNVTDYEVTDLPIPKDSKEKKAEYRKQGYGMKKVDGQWVWVKFKDSSRTENPDIADIYNTVLKMAKKRALVDAALTVTAASDIFTQDIEDLPPGVIEAEVVHPAPGAHEMPKAASKPQTRSKPLASIAERREKALKACGEFGFFKDDLEAWLEKPYSQWEEDELARIKEWYKAEKEKAAGQPEEG